MAKKRLREVPQFVPLQSPTLDELTSVVRSKRISLRRRVTAYHEGGHAVAMLEFGLTFELASIMRMDDKLGGVVPHKLHKPLKPGMEWTPSRRARCNRDVKILLAGSLAASNFTERAGVPLQGIGMSDYRKALDIAKYAYPNGDLDCWAAYISRMTQKTNILLGRPEVWAQVEALAIALLANEIVGLAWGRSLCDQARSKYLQSGDGQIV